MLVRLSYRVWAIAAAYQAAMQGRPHVTVQYLDLDMHASSEKQANAEATQLKSTSVNLDMHMSSYQILTMLGLRLTAINYNA